jgi:membrane associated rhomboid family serine protease
MDQACVASPSAATLALPSNDEITPVESGQETEKAAAKPRASTLAFISYFLSALSFAGWAATRIPLPALGALGVVFGLLALIAIRRKPERLEGRTIAWAGIVAGFLNLIAVSGFSLSSSETYTSFG